MKWRRGCYECSKDDVMGKLKSWRYGYCEYHEVTLWVFWIFMSWRHWYFEYSRGDFMEIFRSWRHGYFEIHIPNCTSFEYSKYLWHQFKNIQNTNVTMNIQNKHVTYSKLHFLLNIQNTHDTHFKNIQKKKTKYPCHIFKITLLLNIQNTHDITSRTF